MIRSYAETDAAQLAVLHNEVYEDGPLTADGFHAKVNVSLAAGGLAWVLSEGSSLSGYGMITPVPGLPCVGDLVGFIGPDRRRIGLGSALLRFMLEALRCTDFRQITHAVTDQDSPAACFLRHHQFIIEHEEWLMELDELNRLPGDVNERPTPLQVYPRATAVSHFCRMYEESFSGLPWNQPFTRAEVVATLVDANDMLFLTDHGEAIGFAWVSLDAEGKGLIEPLAIVPSYQRMGYGRILLRAAINELASRGARRVEIGAWCNNRAAIDLYRSVGFRPQKTFTYLAFNVDENDS